MTRDDALSDLDYVRTLAREGRQAPLLSGRFFVIWGGLGIAALLVHWAALTGRLPGLADGRIALIWVGYGLVGALLSALAGRAVAAKPGASSIGNRASGAVWSASTAIIFGFAAGAVLRNLAASELGWPVAPLLELFDVILVVAFACYAISFWVTAAIGQVGWMQLASAASFLAMLASLVLVGQPILYLFAAGFLVVVAIGPGVALMLAEPKSVV